MGGNVSRVRRRAFPNRSGYSNTPFRGGIKDDMEADMVDKEVAPKKSVRKVIKAKRRLVAWRYKKGVDNVVSLSANQVPDRTTPEPSSRAVPVLLATSPQSDRKCGCQGNGCILCESVENTTPSRMKRKRLVNINTCNVFDLMALECIDQLVATNVVIYREKKGRFKQLDKLLKVPGLTKSTYCQMAPHVTVVSLEDDDSSGLHINEGAPFDSNNGGGSGGNLGPGKGKDKGHSRQSSAVSSQKSSAANDYLDLLLQMPVDTEGRKDLEQANIDLIYRLMCSKSERPKQKPDGEKEAGGSEQQPQSSYDFTRLRLGCWDLEGCSFDKAHNPGVLEVICMTILENKWNYVVMADFTSDHVLDRLVSELNFPTLHKVKMWRQNCQATPRFDCLSLQCPETSFRYGYLFAIPFATVENSEAKGTIFKVGTRSVMFQYGAEDSAHDCAISSSTEDIVRINQRGTEMPSASGNLLYFGKFGVHWNGGIVSKFTGHAGFVEEGLTHLAIPNGWTLGGRVTRSNPIWMHFSLNDGSPIPALKP